jgi:molecular chaperone GrpE
MEKDEEKVDKNEQNQHNSDIEDVEFVEDEEEKNPRDTIKRLRALLKASQKERQEYLEMSQRLRADAINGKRQDEEWRKEFVKFSEEKLILRLLPVLESFSLATGNREVWETLPKDWRLGMDYIYHELLNGLSEHGLIQINPKIGDLFDPNYHISVGVVIALDKKLDQTVAEILQRGYILNGKVLRPARVSVATFETKE